MRSRRVRPSHSQHVPLHAATSPRRPQTARAMRDRVADGLDRRAAVPDDAPHRRCRAAARRRTPSSRRACGTAGTRAATAGSPSGSRTCSAAPRAAGPPPSRPAPSLNFSATLPVNPSHTITSASPAEDAPRLDVADEVQRRGLQQPVRLARQLVPLGLFLADRQQPDARALDAERHVRVGRAHHRRTAADAAGGTRRWRRRRAAPPSPCLVGTTAASAGRSTPAQHPERRVRGHDRRPGVPGADQRGASPVAHQPGRDHDGRTRACAGAPARPTRPSRRRRARRRPGRPAPRRRDAGRARRWICSERPTRSTPMPR